MNTQYFTAVSSNAPSNSVAERTCIRRHRQAHWIHKIINSDDAGHLQQRYIVILYVVDNSVIGVKDNSLERHDLELSGKSDALCRPKHRSEVLRHTFERVTILVYDTMCGSH